ncbi:glycosyltransferase [Phenylobacterium sp.]|uniref:glycosyltransferase n=1 Tax=Phenylobacterium sp. TaxID=1871053 RepID=UPI002BF9FA4F|nr:glycosyltransferase [Phenylobacterium sp.]HVI32365.1 glycosyltransferase [Phenylobacterium sp.]
MAVTALDDEVYRVVSTAVDAAFYRTAYPDLDKPELDPVRHYLSAGWREGRDPAPWFSSRAYLDAHADVRRARVEPLFHYLRHGRYEGREVFPSDRAPVCGPAAQFAEAQPEAANAEEEEAQARRVERELLAGEFDAEFYLAAHQDIAAAGMDPLDHFLITGWREGRDPHPKFSVKDYLETYPDIAHAGMNPFVHYVRTGRAEGRMARNELGFRYEVIARLRPLEDRVAEVAKASAELKLGTVAALAKALGRSRTGLADLHVTFSHDDYRANTGGVQLCLQREDARIVALGRDHLHLYPAKPWPVVRTTGEPGKLGVVWNGENVGVYSPKVIARVLKQAAGAGPAGQRSFAIHSLLGHAADETADILAAAGLQAGWFWLHDFASLCSGYHLLRNDVEDCAAPPPDSAACSICAYFPHRMRHLTEHQRLFERLDLTVVSPSQPTLDLWKARWSFPAKGEVVLPHARLVERGPAPVSRARRPFRLAFAGIPAAFKGWGIFRELVLKHVGDERYEFLHLGVGTQSGVPAAFHEVRVTEAQPRLMQETLEALEVDAVLIWPLCRETFSFTAYEAIAAGCAVITGPDSGNVQALVRDGGHGWVLPDEAALAEALDSGRIAELARARRKPMLHDLAFSALTVDLIAPETAP